MLELGDLRPAVPAPPAHYREPLSIGGMRLASRFVLAPLAGYTNLPFRLTVRELGGLGLATTDLVNARAILEGLRKTRELLATDPRDRPLAVQIFGGNADELAKAAQQLEAEKLADLVDINMGCPVRKVVSTGGGSALMCDTTGKTVDLVRRVVEAVKIPVTVKMRLGWDDTQLTAPFFAREFERIGVKAVTIHGRTREQGFSGSINPDGIRRVVEAVEHIPVFGNGDVRSIVDARDLIARTGCQGLALGRGALANPWIFRQLAYWIDTGEPGPKGTYAEHVDLMRTHVKRLCDWRGSENRGCVMFRKVAAWYGQALRLPKKLRVQLTMLKDLSQFESLVAPVVAGGPPAGWSEHDLQGAAVDVPSGPMAHW
jgi:nifR3 family TIM-barrel protein